MTRRPPGYNEMLTEFGTYINETYEKNISDAYQMMTIEEITNKHLYNYILYNYYKSKLEEKVETFGRAKINTEKKILRHTLPDAINQCHNPNDHPNEVRKAQEKKVLEIPKIIKIPESRR